MEVAQPPSRQPELPGRQVIEPDAVLQVPDRVFDLGVAAVVGIKDQGLALAAGEPDPLSRVILVSITVARYERDAGRVLSEPPSCRAWLAPR